MNLFTGSMITAGLVFAAAAANAQVPAPYRIDNPRYFRASDMQGPMAAIPPEDSRYGIALLPAPEVDNIVRENGFSPLGLPQLRGGVYTVSALDRGGDDGRLVIDARTGRIISFMPARLLGDNLYEEPIVTYGAAAPPPVPRPAFSAPPRLQAALPRVASRTLAGPPPKAQPRLTETKQSAKPGADLKQQSAAVQAKPTEAPPAAQTAPPVAAPAQSSTALIRPTQKLPEVQGLD